MCTQSWKILAECLVLAESETIRLQHLSTVAYAALQAWPIKAQCFFFCSLRLSECNGWLHCCGCDGCWLDDYRLGSGWFNDCRGRDNLHGYNSQGSHSYGEPYLHDTAKSATTGGKRNTNIRILWWLLWKRNVSSAQSALCGSVDKCHWLSNG